MSYQRSPIRPLRYDLNQILYDYTVEVTNRFKGLNLTVFLKTNCYRFITLYRRQFKTLLKGKKMQGGKVVI